MKITQLVKFYLLRDFYDYNAASNIFSILRNIRIYNSRLYVEIGIIKSILRSRNSVRVGEFYFIMCIIARF